jgi:hypothetical protein
LQDIGKEILTMAQTRSQRIRTTEITKKRNETPVVETSFKES